MTETEQQILDATIALVSVYGMRKTSVGDVAERSGLSRQTVYNLFGNKDEIYRAAIEYLGEQWRAKARAGLEKAESLPEQLDVVFDVFAIDAFKFSRSKPDARDMFSEAHVVAGDVMQNFFQENRDVIAGVLRPYASKLKKNGLSIEQFADQIETACRGYKRDARSLKHLKELLATQKKLILMMMSQLQVRPSLGPIEELANALPGRSQTISVRYRQPPVRALIAHGAPFSGH